MKLSKEKIIDVLKISEDINHIKDIDSLLDRVLAEARHATGADAGSIYLVNEGKLSFEYVQNETLAKRDNSSNRYIYQKREMPINARSLAGYVAMTRQPLAVDDAYSIPGYLPYSFNKSFDILADYRTGAILTVPLVTSRERIIGIMQIINPVDISDSPVSFSRDHQLLVQ